MSDKIKENIYLYVTMCRNMSPLSATHIPKENKHSKNSGVNKDVRDHLVQE